MKKIVELSIELEIEIDENESLEEFARNRLTYSVSDFPSASGNLVRETGNYRIGRVEKEDAIKALQLIEDENGSELCYCNNCSCYLIDNNPRFGAKKYDTNIACGELAQFLEPPKKEDHLGDKEFFWGCPNCKTDDFLVDV